MHLVLKGFQQVAVQELMTHLRVAQAEALSFPQAILLSAPTGAGKTAIATAAIESLMEGDAEGDGSDQTTVLWLTDQPELNEQTRRKMSAHSEILGDSRLVTIEQTFMDDVLAPGSVYFLNTQKLGRNSGLVNPRDHRPWTLWQTIQRTIERRPRDFVLVIDEAHRGMSESEKDRKAAQTIVQKFIKGADEISPVPIIFGISATPDRFLGMVAGRRNLRPQVEVSPEAVRESGLLKQTLLVYHPTRREPSDYTLLRAAAQRLADYKNGWTDYRKRSEAAEIVQPILVVQVSNAPAGRTTKVTDTDLAMAVSVIEAVLGPLDEAAMGHSFQEETALPIGDGRMLRYVAPSDIQEDSGLRLVFFKTALTTGWDCPRAEVIMSFRRARDHTTIAQLVGRMVRTPLARTVEDDEFLNSVSLYLPHYDQEGLDKVLDRLQQEDPEFLPPLDVQRGFERTRLSKNPAMTECFGVLAGLPTYDVVQARATTNLRRAVKLARLLDRDGITTDELSTLQTEVTALLHQARKQVEKADWWKDVVKDEGTIDLRTLEWALGVGEVSEHHSVVPVTQKNVDDLFSAAGRKLGEGLHKVYWRARAAEDQSQRMVRRIAKLEIYALSQQPKIQGQLEAFAAQKIADLQAGYGSEVDRLPGDRKDGYRQVRLTARDPEPRTLDVFTHIEGHSAGSKWRDHLYLDDNGEFRYSFKSSWEALILKAAMADKGFVGWLRLEDRKAWAIAVPYQLGGQMKPLYPDLLIFRRTARKLTVDILDPHDPSRDDWTAKVKGLAAYAAKHWASFGRIEVSFIDKKAVYRLDLAVERNRSLALSTDGPNHLRSLFSADQ